MGKTLGIISIKGGVGKTSVSVSLAATLAKDFNKKILVIDANFNGPNLGHHIGLFNPDVTIHDVLTDKILAKDAIIDSGHGFDILPGALLYDKIEPLKLQDKIRDLKRKYDLIIIDSSPNLNQEILATIAASDELMIVTTPDVITLASTIKATKIAQEKRTPIIGIILNKVYGKSFEIDLEDIENVSGINVLAVIPHETAIPEAQSKGIPSTLHKETPSTIEYRKLAASLLGQNYDEEKGFLKIFMKKVPRQSVNRIILKDDRVNNPFHS